MTEAMLAKRILLGNKCVLSAWSLCSRLEKGGAESGDN